MTRRAASAIALLIAAAATADAEPAPSIVAAVAGADSSITAIWLVGPSGQIYRPVSASPWTWRRDRAGGVSTDVVAAGRTPTGLLVIGERTPLFAHDGVAWHAQPLPTRGDARLGGDGSALVVATGRHIYTRRGDDWRRLGAAPAVPTALWSSTPERAIVALPDGRVGRLDARAFTPIVGTLTDDPIIALAGAASDALYGVTAAGVILRIGTGARVRALPTPPELAGWQPWTAGTAGAAVIVAGTIPAVDAPSRPVLVHIDGDVVTITDVPWLTAADAITVVRGDAAGGRLIATRAGALRVRASADTPWQTATIDASLPPTAPTAPGSHPARSP